ncbi:unnamed protein product [Ectocarpus fasciculatus]
MVPSSSYGSGSYSRGEFPSSAMSQYSSFASNYEDLLAEYLPEYTATDIGFAWFLLVVSSGCFVLMAVTMVLFIQKRNVFEIKARSAYVVLLSGVCLMQAVVLTIVWQTVVLFNFSPRVYPFFMASISFFFLCCGTCCYGSRTIRLAVLFNSRARSAVPWLVSERNHVCACLVLGVASLGFPLYIMYDVGDGPFAELLFGTRADAMLWRVNIAMQGLILTLYPLVWKTDDIFNIARELRVSLVLSLLIAVTGRVADDYLSHAVALWINGRVMGFISACIMFSLSLGVPIRQLVLNPLESADPEVSKALTRRKECRAAIGQDSTAPTSTHDACLESSETSATLWTYEKVAAMPNVSAAFDEFARKALCQESILFLKDVTKFQSNGDEEITNDWYGQDAAEDNSSFEAFSQIVMRYIFDGAPDEVNISSSSKAAIVDIYGAGQSAFYDLQPVKRRFIFTSLYAEIRFVLESNLMNRFLSTIGFKTALSKDRAESSTFGGVRAENPQKESVPA